MRIQKLKIISCEQANRNFSMVVLLKAPQVEEPLREICSNPCINDRDKKKRQKRVLADDQGWKMLSLDINYLNATNQLVW